MIFSHRAIETQSAVKFCKENFLQFSVKIKIMKLQPSMYRNNLFSVILYRKSDSKI